ncbi:hypothetical protein IID62_11140 [candidate division KSB1 bacterium]|nr:hypothetical protein [candidate division KSB1 bacterium]
MLRSICSKLMSAFPIVLMNTALIIIILFFTGIPVKAQVSVSGSVAFVTKYIWRGYNIVDDPAIQPSLDFGFGESGFSANVWYSAGLSKRDKNGAADELDFTLDYSTSLANGAAISLGFIYYTFPNQDNFDFGDHATPEIYAAFTPGVPYLSPTLTLYYDFNLGDDLYATIGIDHTAEAGEGSVGASALLAYNNGQFGANSGFSHVELSVFAAIPAGAFEIAPSLTFFGLFEDTVNPDNEIYFSLNVGWSF